MDTGMRMRMNSTAAVDGPDSSQVVLTDMLHGKLHLPQLGSLLRVLQVEVELKGLEGLVEGRRSHSEEIRVPYHEGGEQEMAESLTARCPLVWEPLHANLHCYPGAFVLGVSPVAKTRSIFDGR